MTLRFQSLLCILIATSVSICQADEANTGQLKMRFEYGGAPPAQKPVPNLGQCGNVNVVEEMVGMIIAQRAYEANSKAIQTADQMLQMANNIKR